MPSVTPTRSTIARLTQDEVIEAVATWLRATGHEVPKVKGGYIHVIYHPEATVIESVQVVIGHEGPEEQFRPQPPAF